MKTEKRIEKLAEAVESLFEKFDRKITVADVATDHGYLSEKLNSDEKIEKIYSTDISEKSLNKLVRLKEKEHLEKVEPLLGNGLEPLTKVDITVIAGIGAFEIIKIIDSQNVIKNKEVKCKYFVLQPAQNIVQLREWIYKNKYKVLNDFIIKDGEQFYPVVIVNVSKKQLNRKSVKNLWLGKSCDLKNDDFKLFLIEKQKNLQFINNLSQKRVKNDEILLQKRKLLKIIEEMLINTEL